MPDWSTALPDWERRIVAGESLIPFAPLFPSEAQAALDVFNELRVVDMPGSPKMAEVARPWLLDFVASIFGAYDPESGRRLVREWFLFISKKNGKSSTAAGVMLTALLLNWRQSGEMGILAPTIEVANNAYFPARDMVKADPELSALLQVQDHLRKITHRETGATLQVVAADSETVAGKKWIVTLVDELWLFGKKPNADKMLIEATGGMASRPEGFVIYLSTQSDDPPAGVFAEKLSYARKVRDGEIVDPEFCPVLYEFPKAMVESQAYLDEKNWHVTNPNLGASVDERFIRSKLLQAKEAGGAAMQNILAKHLNVQIGLSLSADRWAGAEFWEQCGDPALTLDQLLQRCEVVVAGIDGGGLDDLLGLHLVGRETGTGLWLTWGHAWAHRIVLSRRREIASRLLDFERDGDLTIVDLPGDDVRALADVLCRVKETGLMPEKAAVGVDTAGISEIVDELTTEDRGFTMDHIIGVSQGWRMTGAIKTAERKIAGRELVHGARPLMAWCVGNAKAEPKGNAITITKQVSGSAKIDPLMALFDALTLMGMNPVAAAGNVPQIINLELV
jgi:phage terminase large subunit-like protein